MQSIDARTIAPDRGMLGGESILGRACVDLDVGSGQRSLRHDPTPSADELESFGSQLSDTHYRYSCRRSHTWHARADAFQQ